METDVKVEPERPLTAQFLDRSGTPAAKIDDGIWPPLVIPRAQIEAEIERLCAIEPPPDGRRSSMIVHPLAESPGLGLAPGIRVSLEVLLSGERTLPIRHNSSQVVFCIEGSGFAVVGLKRFDFERYDVWVTPAMTTYYHANESEHRQVRLTYSNAALLEKLHVHYVDEQPPEESPVSASAPSGVQDTHELRDTMRIGEGSEMLMTYEKLIDPDLVPQEPLHWPWQEVRRHLDELTALGSSYRGRRLYLLYNPATGRTNGTTNSFFATMTVRPPKIVDRPHRHAAAAINYFFSGSGWSTVSGKRYEWAAGDLMLTAPGWAIHHHASNDEPVYELTVQDSPHHIALNSLMWQEDLRNPPRLLGSQVGFGTNRSVVS